MKEEKNIFDYMKNKERESFDPSYFSNMAQSIIANNSIVHPKVIPFYKKAKFWIVTASSSAAAILIFLFSINNSTNINYADKSIAKKDLIAYIDHNIDQFDEDLIQNHISTQNKNTVLSSQIEVKISEQKSAFEIISIDEINKEDVLEYLENENLSIEDLENNEETY